MTRHTAILLAALLLTALALGGLAAVVFADSAAAQEQPSTLDQLSNADSEALLAGLRGRISGWVNARLAFLSGDETTSADACDDLQAEFNANNGTITDWANNRTTADTDLDTVAITCDTGEDPETVYLTADVADGNYSNASVVDATGREVDAECTLQEDAADNAADELDTFVDEFASSGTNVSESYRTRLAAQYAGDVSCDGVAGVSG